jgi:putative chitinase
MLLTESCLEGINLKEDCAPCLLSYGNQYADEYEVNTPLRLAHFMAQVCHESNGFNRNIESLVYKTPQRLMQVWPRRFPTLELANQYVNNEEKLANYVYANRMGNGDAASGDGYRYRGRGPMQTTGKDMYARLSKKFFNDDTLLKNPNLLCNLQYGLRAAFVEWDDNNLNKYADANDIVTITIKINGGKTGLDQRRQWFDIWSKKLGIGAAAPVH